MSAGPGRRRTLLGLLCLALSAAACTEEDAIFDQVGTARIFIVHSGLVGQTIDPSSSPIQEARWDGVKATLTIGGTTVVLEDADNCIIRDTFLFALGTEGCSSGLVLDASGPQTIEVVLEFDKMTLYRAAPAPILMGGVMGDIDGDGILDNVDMMGMAYENLCRGGQTVDCDDNCGLIPNANQTDADTAAGLDTLCDTLDDNIALYGDDDLCGTADDEVGDFIGDACALAFNVRDSDGDMVEDFIDNCVAWPNMGQELGVGIGLIGMACEQQAVADMAAFPLTVSGAMLDRGRLHFLTADFGNALNCDFVLETCPALATPLFCVTQGAGADCGAGR